MAQKVYSDYQCLKILDIISMFFWDYMSISTVFLFIPEDTSVFLGYFHVFPTGYPCITTTIYNFLLRLKIVNQKSTLLSQMILWSRSQKNMNVMLVQADLSFRLTNAVEQRQLGLLLIKPSDFHQCSRMFADETFHFLTFFITHITLTCQMLVISAIQ